LATPESRMEKVEGPKACSDSEIAPTLDLINLVHRTLRGMEPTIGQDYSHIYQHENLENVRVIKVDGKIVSSVGLFPSEVKVGDVTIKVGGINCLATHPDYRRHGYASILTKDCIRKMEEEHYDLSMLGTQITEYYRRFDWENGGVENIYTFDRGNVTLLPDLNNCKVQEGFEDYLEEIHSVHSQERLGAIRDLQLTKILLGRPNTNTYVAVKDGQLAAYIILRGERVVEYGGEVRFVTGLIREVFRRRDKPEASTTARDQRTFRPALQARLSVITPAYDMAGRLPKVLDDLDIPKQVGYLGMLRIINLQRLLKKFNLDEIKVEEEEEKTSLQEGSRRAEFTRRELVKLVFGPERLSDFARNLFPIPFYQWPLDHV